MGLGFIILMVVFGITIWTWAAALWMGLVSSGVAMITYGIMKENKHWEK